MRGTMLAGVVIAAFLPPGAAAFADVPLAGTFDEHLSDAKVSGQVLVGLWLGEPTGTIALNPTRLVLPARTAAIRACVTASTRDGEYWMHGVFDVPSGPAALGDMSIQSHYQTSLAAYKLSDLGVSAELKQDCGDVAAGPLVPIASGADVSRLVALVNSQRAIRVEVTLQSHGSDIVTGQCVHYEGGRSTAFDTICRITLPTTLAAGSYGISLSRLTRAGDSQHDAFPVSLDTGLH